MRRFLDDGRDLTAWRPVLDTVRVNPLADGGRQLILRTGTDEASAVLDADAARILAERLIGPPEAVSTMGANVEDTDGFLAAWKLARPDLFGAPAAPPGIAASPAAPAGRGELPVPGPVDIAPGRRLVDDVAFALPWAALAGWGLVGIACAVVWTGAARVAAAAGLGHWLAWAGLGAAAFLTLAMPVIATDLLSRR